jgi:predicted protein tyrosine phosphatase
MFTSVNTPGGFLSVKSLVDARREWCCFDHVITIEDIGLEDGLRIPPSGGVGQTVVQFDDVDSAFPVERAPQPAVIKGLLIEARRHTGGRLLIHCMQGQSRSAALALGVIADRIGEGREAEAVDILLRTRPTAVCNRLMVRYIDILLQRGGKLVKAWQAHLDMDDRAAGVLLLRELATRQGL